MRIKSTDNKPKAKLILRVPDEIWNAFQGIVPRSKTTSQVISELMKKELKQKNEI